MVCILCYLCNNDVPIRVFHALVKKWRELADVSAQTRACYNHHLFSSCFDQNISYNILIFILLVAFLECSSEEGDPVIIFVGRMFAVDEQV